MQQVDRRVRQNDSPMMKQLIANLAWFCVLFFCAEMAQADLVATVDFDAQTIKFTGEDQGDLQAVGGNTYSLQWRQDFLPPEQVGTGSQQSALSSVAFSALHIASGTNLNFNFDMVARDSIAQFTFAEDDWLELRMQVVSPLDLADGVSIHSSGVEHDISAWDQGSLFNLQEAIAHGSISLDIGSGFSPIRFQSTVPEPSSFTLLVIAACFLAKKNRRRNACR